MKRLLAVVLFCFPAFGQAAYSGLGLRSGSSVYAVGSCAAPNFCAYAGTDIIPWGTVPNFGGATKNNTTNYDTSYLGHTNLDGSTFSNSALLSPISRLTDSGITYGKTNANFNAGIGDTALFKMTNPTTNLVQL